MDPHEYVLKFLDDAEHKPGCTAIIADTDAVCSCGLKEARECASQLGGEPECDGNCAVNDDLEDLRFKINDIVTSPGWYTIRRDDLKPILEKLCQ